MEPSFASVEPNPPGKLGKGCPPGFEGEMPKPNHMAGLGFVVLGLPYEALVPKLWSPVLQVQKTS